MMKWCRNFSLVLVAVLLQIGLPACQSGAKKKSGSGEASPGVLETPGEFLGGFDVDLVLEGKDNLSDEILWALAQCDCAPTLFKPYFEKTAGGSGVLPQILIPTVREQIKSNSALQTLQKIPLGGLLADFFASDEKLRDLVRQGLSEKLKRAPGGSNLGERLQFRFDGFTPRAGGKSSFDVSGQIPRWSGVFGADGLWTGRTLIDSRDHGLQTLELLRTLAEWKYLIGLDKNSDGGFYGGLSLSVESGQPKLNGPIDLRSRKAPAWYLSGSYTLSYDDKNSRDLATSVKEIWKHGNEAVSLDEQSRLWLTAARAFKRLRPENRKNIRALFGAEPEALLPPETHLLPLAFMTGMKLLLPGPFIEKDVRLIRAYAALDGAGDEKQAKMVTIARLSRALTAWITELKTVASAGLDPDTLKKVEAAPEELQPALQLSVQTILKDHTIPATEAGGSYGLALHEAGAAPDLADSCEVLVALMEIENDLLKSEFLRNRIFQLLDWFAGDVLKSTGKVSVKELVWIRAVAEAATAYADDRVNGWAPAVINFVDQKLKD